MPKSSAARSKTSSGLVPLRRRRSTEPVTRYAEDAVDGRFPVCRLVRLACERHLRDLIEGPARGLVWRPDLAAYAIEFFAYLHHSKGEWAGQPLVLAPWQAFCVGSVFGWLLKKDGFRRFRVVYQEIPRKNGKALAIETMIATPDGWKKHGDLLAGDMVFNPAGIPVAVLSVTPSYQGPCYDMGFSDGAHIFSHARHEWRTNRTWFTGRSKGPNGKRPLPEVETRTIAATLTLPQRPIRGRYPHAAEYVHGIWTTAPLDLPEVVLPVPPYTFGAWLGDGHSLGPRITAADPEIVAAIAADGVPIRETKGRRGLAGIYSMTVRTVVPGVKGWASLGLHAGLRSLGVLGAKSIPLLYQRGSIAQRRQLLAGIIDTDGHVTERGQCEITLTNASLFDDVVELARTLGYKATVSESRAKINGRDIGPRYRMQFWPTFDELPLRVPRKRDRLRHVPSGRSRTRMIVSCDKVGERTVNCIEVEGGMYLAGAALIATHNSTSLAAVGVYALVADNEPGAEIYIAATKKDQARIIFGEAQRMVRSSPELRAFIGIFKNNLSNDSTASKFEPLSSDERTLDGLNPSCVLIDELHKHRNRALLDVMDTALGSRRQPLLWMITTAGDDNPESVYANENDYATKILERVVEDDNEFAFITTIDADDRWDDPKAWAKANPNLGVSVKFDDLQRQAAKAKNSPPAQASFKRLRLNVRQSSSDQAIDMEVWRENSLGAFDPASLYGRRFYGGLDLSSKVDLTAWIKLFPPIEDEERWTVVCRFWMPNDTIAEKSDRDRVQYQRWVDGGLIEPTEGNVIDHGEIAMAVMEDCRLYVPATIAYDPWNAAQLSVQLLGEGAPMVEFIQGVRSYNAATKELDALLQAHKLDHGDNAVLTWMAHNLRITMADRNNNIMPSKKHSTGRIDGISGLIMAIGRSMADDNGRNMDGFLSNPLSV